MTAWNTGAAALAMTLMLGAGSAAHAGIYSDDLTRCLVKSTADADKTMLVQWMFAEVSLNPALSKIASVTPADREGYEKKGAALFDRLVLTDCRKETEAAIKYEGSGAFAASFQALGEVAARGLMNDPKVTAGLTSMVAYLDKPKWEALAKEAGVPTAMAVGK